MFFNFDLSFSRISSPVIDWFIIETKSNELLPVENFKRDSLVDMLRKPHEYFTDETTRIVMSLLSNYKQNIGMCRV